MSKQDQKITLNRYQVVPRTLIFIICDDEILLLRGADDKKIWPGLFNGVGGHVEAGESVLEAAKRELFEETGMTNIDLNLKAVISIDINEKIGINNFVFLGETKIKDFESSKEGNLKWIKNNDISNHPLVEDLYILIPKIFTSKNNVIFGSYYYQNDELKMKFN